MGVTDDRWLVLRFRFRTGSGTEQRVNRPLSVQRRVGRGERWRPAHKPHRRGVRLSRIECSLADNVSLPRLSQAKDSVNQKARVSLGRKSGTHPRKKTRGWGSLFSGAERRCVGRFLTCRKQRLHSLAHGSMSAIAILQQLPTPTVVCSLSCACYSWR
jgi:hypothetical protein